MSHVKYLAFVGLDPGILSWLCLEFYVYFAWASGHCMWAGLGIKVAQVEEEETKKDFKPSKNLIPRRSRPYPWMTLLLLPPLLSKEGFGKARGAGTE